jgi:hypothetical protein
MLKEKNLQQLGIGVASLTFGVALSIFIYAAATGIVNSLPSALLYITSFLLMLRFWWRYTELFIQHLPSRSFTQFLLDFVISFFGILAVLFIGNIQTWAAIGSASMIASMIRCSLSWNYAKTPVKKSLKKTIFGSLAMLIIFTVVYTLAPAVNNLWLAEAVFALTIIFVAYASVKK